MQNQTITGADIQKLAKVFFNVLAFALLCFSAHTVYQLVQINRCLWLDECMLALSFKEFTLWQLITQPLSHAQNAPFIFVMLTKAVITFFGRGEAVLRLVPLVSYAATVVLSGVVLKCVFRSRFAMLGAALVSCIPIMQQYANEFKQYSFECAVFLSIALLYGLYKQQRVSAGVLYGAMAFSLWCANAAVLLSGAICLYELLCAFWGKPLKAWRAQLPLLLRSAGVLCSLLVYYVFWLQRNMGVADIQAWLNVRFPVWPLNLETLQKQWELTGGMIYQQIGTVSILLGAFFLLGFLLRGKHLPAASKPLLWVLLLCGGMMLFTSSLALYPLVVRLMLFVLPCCVILGMVGLDALLTCFPQRFSAIRMLAWCLVSLCLLQAGYRLGQRYAKPQNYMDLLYNDTGNRDIFALFEREHGGEQAKVLLFGIYHPSYLYYTQPEAWANMEVELGSQEDILSGSEWIREQKDCYVICPFYVIEWTYAPALAEDGAFTTIRDDGATRLAHYQAYA